MSHGLGHGAVNLVVGKRAAHATQFVRVVENRPGIEAVLTYAPGQHASRREEPRSQESYRIKAKTLALTKHQPPPVFWRC